jgi:hypothetical protein
LIMLLQPKNLGDINLIHDQVSTGRCIAICMYQV